MSNRITFRKQYAILTLILFIVEVIIAVYVHDSFIRPYIGDVFVVILIYCFVRTFAEVAVLPAASGVLIFAFLIEGLQYIKIVNKLGWENSTFANTVIGTSFAWEDLVAYVTGTGIVWFLETLYAPHDKK